MVFKMKWYKSSNTTTIDPTFAVIAKKSKSYKCEVLAVWFHLLERASRKGEAGFIGDLDPEEIELALDLLPGKLIKIVACMGERGLIEKGFIAGWGKFQADPTNAERQKKWRERQNNQEVSEGRNSYVTENNAVTLEEKRGEEIREEYIPPTRGKNPLLPDKLPFEWQNYAVNLQATPELLADSFEAFINYHVSKGTKADSFFGFWKNWIKKDINDARIKNTTGRNVGANGSAAKTTMGSGQTQASRGKASQLDEIGARFIAKHASEAETLDAEAGQESDRELLSYTQAMLPNS